MQHPQLFRPTFLARAVFAAAVSFACTAQAGLWEAVVDTTPAGYARQSSEHPGDWASFWSDTKEGTKRIFEEGNSVWIVPTYTNHPTWAWKKRHEENGYPFGMGYARQVIDNRGNERLLFAVNFVDSNYRIEPMVGYSWLARWPIGSTGLHVGAGYLAGITMRGDYMWAPLPLPLPVAKIGTDTVSFYGTFIPFTNVFFFYSTITVDDAKGRKMPLASDSPWVKSPNLLYGSYGWQYVDNGEEYSKSLMKNDTIWNIGLRRYSGRSWQTDLKYSRAQHDVAYADGSGKQSIDFRTYTLTISYNIDVTKSLRLFAGAGVGYGKAEGPYNSDTSIFPALTLGGTWAFTDHFWLTGSMDTNFPRYKGVLADRDSEYVLKSMPTAFTLGLGFAF